MLAVTGESGVRQRARSLSSLGLVAQLDRGGRFRGESVDGSRSNIHDLWLRQDQGEASTHRRPIDRLRATDRRAAALPKRARQHPVNRHLLGLPLKTPFLDDLVERLEIGNLLSKKPGQLPIGQQGKMSIGRALAHAPALLLADEPTSALDLETRRSGHGSADRFGPAPACNSNQYHPRGRAGAGAGAARAECEAGRPTAGYRSAFCQELVESVVDGSRLTDRSPKANPSITL